MRTVLKILAGVAILAVVVVLGVVVALRTVDVNTLIAPIRDRVQAATGRTLTVKGGADLALSLTPKLVLKDVTLGNAPWGKAPQMISAQRLELQVALLPLLSRRFELVELNLVGPVIALESDGKDRRNWDFPGAGGATPATAPAPAAGSAAGVVAAGNVVITDGTLTYLDGRTGDVTRVAIERFFVRARDPNQPVAAEFRGKVDDVAMALEGTLGPMAGLLEKRWPYPVSLKGQVEGRPTEFDAKIKAQDNVYTLEALNVKLGANAVTGEFAVVTGGPRPRLKFALRSPGLTLADLPIVVRTSATANAAGAAARGPWIFPATPVSFAALREVDAEGSLTAARFVLAEGRVVENLRLVGTLNAGRLELSTLQGAMLGGTLAGGLTIDATQAGSSTLALRLNGNGLPLGALLAAAGTPREVRGGSSDLSIALSMRGRSPHEWASTATGNVRLVVGPATLVNTKLNLDASIERLFEAVNPFRASDPSTELVCAVIRLPLENGIARVDRSIAMETRKLGVTASGTLDLRNETIDFSFSPRVHKGIPIQIPNIAQLVRFAGPIRAPEVKVDAVASAAAIASIGAAVGTGGLSAVGQALFSSVEAGGEGPCKVALGAPAGTARAKEAPAKSANPATTTVEDVGKAIGRLFGK